MSKRSGDSDAEGGSDLDTRSHKLPKDDAGQPVTSLQVKKDQEQDKVATTAAALLSGLAEKLIDDPNGEGQELWNNTTTGPPLHRLAKAIVSNSRKYPLESTNNAPPTRPPAVETTQLTEAQIKNQLSTDVVMALQDPEYYPEADDQPLLQVYGMRKDMDASVGGHARKISTISLSLVDGSGRLINAKVAVTSTDKADRLRKGYLIKLMEYHRIFMSPYDDMYSTVGVGVVHFDIIGKGPVATDGEYIAAPRLDTADLAGRVCGDDGSNSNSDEVGNQWDPLADWNEQYERPPVPDRCTRSSRSCSRYGTLFFSKCVCEVRPVPSESDLGELAKLYWATDRPVDEMPNNLRRNLLYWWYATDIYYVRGWLNRMSLPPCLVFEIRRQYPNAKGDPYKEFEEAIR